MRQSRAEFEREMERIFEESARERDAETQRRNSPEALAQQEADRQSWWEARDLAKGACKLVKAAAAKADTEQLVALDLRIRGVLWHGRWRELPSGQAALQRALGLIHEACGRRLDAAQCYVAALALDPKVGCAKALRRVEGR
jgi:tetratricopeptide (TPR) repeat protein